MLIRPLAYLTGQQHEQQVRRAGEGAGDLLPRRCTMFVAAAAAHVNSKLLLLHSASPKGNRVQLQLSPWLCTHHLMALMLRWCMTICCNASSHKL